MRKGASSQGRGWPAFGDDRVRSWMPIPSEDGDVGANPPGFDRQAFLHRLKLELPVFFDKAFR